MVLVSAFKDSFLCDWVCVCEGGGGAVEGRRFYSSPKLRSPKLSSCAARLPSRRDDDPLRRWLKKGAGNHALTVTES